MIKRLFFASILAITLFTTTISLTGCFNEEVDEYYVAVSPGITLFDYASLTNELALDGVSVAMRLSLLLNEIEEYEATSNESFTIGVEGEDEPDWDLLGTIEFTTSEVDGTTVKYYRKDLLLGDTDAVKIWRSNNSGEYYICYGVSSGSSTYHTRAQLDDVYYRRGTYLIKTNGVSRLEETTEATAWSISVVDDVMEFSMGFDAYSEYSCDYTNASSTIYYGDIEDNDNNRGFIYDITNIAPSFTSSAAVTDWSMKGYVNVVDLVEGVDSFSLDDTINKRYELDIYAKGTPIAVPSMTFYTIDPIEYRPATTGFSRYNSEIIIVLDAVSDEYEATDVNIELRNDGYMNVEYNGVTYYADEDDDDDD